MKSILYSDKNFGGAEIYVRTLKTKFNIDFFSLKNIKAFSLFKLLLNEDRIIFHDLRAAFLKFLRPFSSDFIVIHGPGKIKLITKIVINLLRLLNSQIVLVSDELYSMFRIKYNLNLLKNYSSFGEIKLNNSNKDFIYFGRLEKTKGVDLLVEYWSKNINGKKLHLVGDGLLYKKFKSLNNPNIIVYGSLPQNKIKKIIKENCRFYISFSKREGLSLSLLESLSCGLIPIVVNIPTQKFIKNIYGFELVDKSFSNLNELFSKYNKDSFNLISKGIVDNFTKYSNESDFYLFWTRKINKD